MNTQINEDYVSFEVAKLLKEKGFQQLQDNCGYFTTEMIYSINTDNNGEHHFAHQYPDVMYCKDTYIAAPTLQMAMKWLREVHNVFIDISSRFSKNADEDVCFSYSCKKLIDAYKTSYEVGDGEWLNYEEAAEAAIKYCLANLI